MKTNNLALTSAMTALMCLAGMFMHWVSPALVPFSILPILVLLSGLVLGGESGALAMIAYIFLGIMGLPVFASAPFGGLGYVLMPTFGYLLGYIAATYIAGKLYRKPGLIAAIFAVLAGLAALYVVGLGYLYIVLRWILVRPATVGIVLATGFFPFILGDLLKAGIAAFVGNEIRKYQKKIQATTE
jgi:biotin transport system substrate-specific component